MFNKDWLPYVLGGLFQLVNPSSWLVSDDAALQLALERATSLLDLFGQAPSCMNNYVGNCLTANVALPGDVLTTVLSLTVEPGEYELAAQAVLAYPSGALHFTYAIWDGTDKLSEGQVTSPNAGWYSDIGITAHVAPTVTTTYYFKVIPFGGSSFAYADPPQHGTGAHVSTCLRAYPLSLRGPAGPPGPSGLCTVLRFSDGCVLQSSCDDGETWSDVPGWVDNFKACVIANAPIIGLPPNPGDESKDQFACSIAAYLADQVILLAMQKAVNAIQDDLTLLVFGANVLTIIPEFILVAAAYDAFAAIYGAIAEGTLAHYEAAIADETLWQEVTCAIYNAIRSDGYVTPGNFAAILTNLGAISYTYTDVRSAIVAYVTSLGATGLAQLSQRAGLLVGSSCDCGSGSWCYEFGGGKGNFCDGRWTTYSGTPANGVCSSDHWGVIADSGYYTLHIKMTFPFHRTIDYLQLDYSSVTFEYFHIKLYDHEGGTVLLDTTANIASGSWAGVGFCEIYIQQSSQPFTVNDLILQGPAQGSPFGTANC